MRHWKIQLFLTFSVFIPMTFLSTFNCIAQDTSKTEKILLLERTVIEKYQDKPTRRIFEVGDRITIKRYSNDSLIHGKIDSLADSAIIIKGITISLKDIKRINANRGSVTTMTGVSVTAISVAILAALLNDSFKNDYDKEDWPYKNLGIFALYGTVVGGALIFVGIIEMSTVRYYHLDKDFVLYIKTNDKNK